MKRSLIFIVTMLFCSVSFAQSLFELSFSASPTINWMSPGVKEIQKNKSTLGYEFGVNADIFFDQEMRYAFTTGVLVSQTGGELTYNTADNFTFAGNEFDSGTSIRYRLSYVEVPLALKMRTNQFHRWTYWGLFGLSSGINVTAKGDSSDEQFDQSDINKQVKLFNMALNLGLGSEFDLGGRNALVLGLAYKSGFVDVTKGGLGEKTTLNSLTFKLGLVF
ncbi:porin family protein [Mangrovibacterium sp.]|uniref:porin family protein n=1 Tax=Mangrovibacterium sp. TaxID=1961364 RepID=UPI003568CE52